MTKQSSKKSVLSRISDPCDISLLDESELKALSDETRAFLIETVQKSGGHFGSNLGVVELTTALHYVYDSPRDRIVWDVGHQAYAHKVFTGRKDQLHTIRQKNGLSPFPKRCENPHDAFGVGHSSTSVSAAIGMAAAHTGEADAPHMVAVIGDAAFGGGMVFEAINHAGDCDADVLVILNDNKMSISPNVGALHKYLTRLISSPAYLSIRKKGKKILAPLPSVQELMRRTEEYAKGMITPGTIFEEMGFGYYGPIDGHDVGALTQVLQNLKDVRGPRLLHVVTTKGKGLPEAEKDALSMHSVSPASACQQPKPKNDTYTEIFSEWIVATAKKDKRLHAVTPAMREGSGLVDFACTFPERYHDVGIAEQHAVTFAAGLACEGAKPVIAIYSTFLQRAYDQLIHDVALQNLDVLLAIDRAGVVGPDGATHAGSFDLSYMRCVPNMTILVPADADECTRMLTWGYEYEGPVAVRYARSTVHNLKHTRESIELGKGDTLRKGEKVAILAWGVTVNAAMKAAEETNATLVNMRFVKPLDEDLLRELAQTHDLFVTIEDNAVMGGAGSAVNEFVMREDLPVRVKNIGLPDRYLEHGSRDELLEDAGLDDNSIIKIVKDLV